MLGLHHPKMRTYPALMTVRSLIQIVMRSLILTRTSPIKLTRSKLQIGG